MQIISSNIGNFILKTIMLKIFICIKQFLKKYIIVTDRP
jgi:hypothetical protein